LHRRVEEGANLQREDQQREEQGQRLLQVLELEEQPVSGQEEGVGKG
jgi:hypothetical protein